MSSNKSEEQQQQQQQNQPQQQGEKVIAGKKAEDGMVLPLNEAFAGLYTSNGDKITFQASEAFAKDPSNVQPSYEFEDYNQGKTYTLSFVPPMGLATLRIAQMSEEQKQQQNQKASGKTSAAQQKESDEESKSRLERSLETSGKGDTSRKASTTKR